MVNQLMEHDMVNDVTFPSNTFPFVFFVGFCSCPLCQRS